MIPPCHTGQQLQDGGAVASSSLDLTRRKRNYCFSPTPNPRDCIRCTLLGWHLCTGCPGGHVSRINFVLLDSDCLPITLFEVEDLWTEAYLARFPAHTHYGPSHVSAKTHRWCTHKNVFVVLEWGKGPLWLLSHTQNSMRGSLSSFDHHTHLSFTGMPGHSASGVPQVQLLMWNSRMKLPLWPMPSGTG